MGNALTGVKGQPVFNATPSTVVDLQADADYAALVGNVKVLTTSQRTALTGVNVWEGLSVWDTTLSGRYVYRSAAWVRDSPWKWANAAARTATTGMAEGDIGDQADTDMTYRFDGTNWKALASGLIPIIPVAVAGTGVALTPTGRITLSAAGGTVTVNGCFTTAFDNYMIRFDASSGAADNDALFQFAVSGTAIATGYVINQSQISGGAQSLSTPTTFVKPFRLSAVGGCHSRLDISSPALSAYTMITVAASDSISTLSGGGALTSTTVVDGFVITTTTGVNGSIRIYGFNNL